MMIFWMIAVVLVLLALALVLPPLFGNKGGADLDRDAQNIAIARERLCDLKAELAAGALTREQYEEARRELELDLYHDLGETPGGGSPPRGRWAALVVAVAVPLAAGTLYSALGNLQSVEAPAAAGGASARQPPVEEMVAMLAERMKNQPGDLQGWLMLGSSYKVMRRYPEAARALEKAYELAGNDPDVLLQYAQALTMASGGRMEGKPFELVTAALALRPDDLTGLWLAGMAEAQQGNFEASAKYWRRAETLPADDPEVKAELRAMIAEAERRAGISSVQSASATTAPEAASAATAAAIRVAVTLAPELAGQADEGDTLFVYAQALNGSPMPLAIVRKKVKELPLEVVLSDEMAVMPTAKLSGYGEVRIIARISKTADAMPRPGDLFGRAEPVSVGGGKTVQVVIDGKVS